MTSPTFNLQIDPFWFISDINGNPNIGGSVGFFNQATGAEAPVYSDPSGNIIFIYPNPIPVGGDGMIGPLYFESDIAYIMITYDVNGDPIRYVQPVWTGGGGGGSPTTVIGNYNYFPNSSFGNNFTIPSTAPVPTGEIAIAPGNWFFNHDILASNDTLTWQKQLTNAMSPSATPVGNPPVVFNYNNPSLPAGETIKEIYCRFNNVTAFTNRQMTMSFQAKADSAGTGTVFIRQHPAIGSNVITPLASFTFTTTQFSNVVVSNFTVPNTLGLNPAAGGYIDFVIGLTLNQSGNFWIGSPMLQLGNIPNPAWAFESTSDDVYRSIAPTDVFQTGDVKLSYLYTNTMTGWLLMDDGTLGKASPATHAGIIYYDLYAFLWAQNGGIFVQGIPGANAQTDWNNGVLVNLPMTQGRAFANGGRPTPTSSFSPSIYPYGAVEGFQIYQLLPNDLPPHNHTISNMGLQDTNVIAQSPGTHTWLGNSGTYQTNNNLTSNNAFSIQSPTTFLNAFIKL